MLWWFMLVLLHHPMLPALETQTNIEAFNPEAGVA
jgi:hypothetical protein